VSRQPQVLSAEVTAAAPTAAAAVAHFVSAVIDGLQYWLSGDVLAAALKVGCWIFGILFCKSLHCMLLVCTWNC